MPLLLGGDHSITLPEVNALASEHGPVGLGPLRHPHRHRPPTVGRSCRTARPCTTLVDEGHVDPRRYVQIGLRGYWPGEAEFAWQRERGITSFFAHDVRDHGIRRSSRRRSRSSAPGR